MRILLASDWASAKDAVALFVYRIGRELGSMAAALGGIDALVFTAGDRREARLRFDAASARMLRWLGLDLDGHANATGGPADYARGQPSIGLGDSDE